jgi:hypothetical protein
MLGFEQLPWLVCSDWDDTQVKSPENLSQLFEDATVSSVTLVKYCFSLWSFNYKTSPKPFSLIEKTSSGPMPDRYKGDLKLFSIDDESLCLSPIELMNFGFVWKTVL